MYQRQFSAQYVMWRNVGIIANRDLRIMNIRQPPLT